MDKLASTEINEWKTEFLASLTEIEKAAESGSAAAQKQLEETAKALEKATQEFQKEGGRIGQEGGNRRHQDRMRGAEPPITLFVDDSQVAIAAYKQTGLSVMPGIRKIEARATKGTASVQGLDYVKAEPGTTHPLKLKCSEPHTVAAQRHRDRPFACARGKSGNWSG